jgi:hypothetical protein
MSNGVKIGLLIVIAGTLGFIAWRQIQASNGDIESRPATSSVQQDGAAAYAANSSGNAVPTVADPGKAASSALSQTRAKTTWKFEKSEHDFGKIKQGESADYSFKFTNTGKEPLIIENAQGSCGCTVPNYPKEPIAPGATGTIDVRFNSAGKSGMQQKTVTLTANTDPSVTTILTIKADVDAPEEKK